MLKCYLIFRVLGVINLLCILTTRGILYRGGNLSTGKLSSLLEITKLISSGDEIKILDLSDSKDHTIFPLFHAVSKKLKTLRQKYIKCLHFLTYPPIQWLCLPK